MREIKFRAWEIKGKGFIAGFNMVNFHGYFNKGLKPNIYRYETEWEEGEYILEQFTGLLDKNGKEIYEGDIVEYNILGGGKVKMVVAWDIIFGVWEVKNKHTEELLGEVVKENENFEVIGNIYENKDLLS